MIIGRKITGKVIAAAAPGGAVKDIFNIDGSLDVVAEGSSREINVALFDKSIVNEGKSKKVGDTGGLKVNIDNKTLKQYPDGTKSIHVNIDSTMYQDPDSGAIGVNPLDFTEVSAHDKSIAITPEQDGTKGISVNLNDKSLALGANGINVNLADKSLILKTTDAGGIGVKLHDKSIHLGDDGIFVGLVNNGGIIYDDSKDGIKLNIDSTLKISTAGVLGVNIDGSTIIQDQTPTEGPVIDKRTLFLNEDGEIGINTKLGSGMFLTHSIAEINNVFKSAFIGSHHNCYIEYEPEGEESDSVIIDIKNTFTDCVIEFYEHTFSGDVVINNKSGSDIRMSNFSCKNILITQNSSGHIHLQHVHFEKIVVQKGGVFLENSFCTQEAGKASMVFKLDFATLIGRDLTLPTDEFLGPNYLEIRDGSTLNIDALDIPSGLGTDNTSTLVWGGYQLFPRRYAGDEKKVVILTGGKDGDSRPKHR